MNGGSTREALERAIRSHLSRAEHEEAADLTVQGYAAEIYGFLLSFHGDEKAAGAVFASMKERLGRELPTLPAEISCGASAYAIARRAAVSHDRERGRLDALGSTLPVGSARRSSVRRDFGETAKYPSTEQHSRFTALRQSLPREDQELLVLRVDRELTWRELAFVLHEGVEAPSEADLVRGAARLRERFRRIKAYLLELGLREEVVDAEGNLLGVDP